MLLSSGPRPPLPPSNFEPSWTAGPLLEAGCKIPLKATNTQSFPLAKRSYKLCGLTSPETGGRKMSHGLLFYLVAQVDGLVYQSHKA